MKKTITILAITAGSLFADWGSSSAGVRPVDNTMYLKECGSCHFAFQAGLLPKRSWVKMMGNLENHFGSDASLDKEDNNKILAYLVKNASDESMNYKRSRKITNSISNDISPLRISEVPYFVKEHRGIPKRLITQKEVGSISNCVACHITASKGIYSERGIKIPNYGRWDD